MTTQHILEKITAAYGRAMEQQAEILGIHDADLVAVFTKTGRDSLALLCTVLTESGVTNDSFARSFEDTGRKQRSA